MDRQITSTFPLIQQKYIDNSSDGERIASVKAIAKELGEMSPLCQIAICIPAYRESCLLKNTLLNYTLYQLSPDTTPLDPELFEINILLNSPHRDSVQDILTMEVIEDFRSEYPQYHINIAEMVYNFPDKVVMGLIFKDIADATILRNLARNISQEKKSRLIIRTAGADVEALNPLLISRTLALFSDKKILAHRGESRLPPELLKAFPLLHVMQTFAIFFLRQYRGNQTTNGPFSYTAEVYAAVDGFDPDIKLGEEVDLAQKIFHYCEGSEGKWIFFCDTVKDVIHNPRRQVYSLLNGAVMASRYKNFGTSANENNVHSMSLSWKEIRPELLPDSCTLTPENLSREVSGYFRTYLRIAKANKIPLEIIDVIFGRGFHLSGITQYITHKSSFMSDNHIEIHNIDGLIQHIESQNFSWGEIFNHNAPQLTLK